MGFNFLQARIRCFNTTELFESISFESVTGSDFENPWFDLSINWNHVRNFKLKCRHEAYHWFSPYMKQNNTKNRSIELRMKCNDNYEFLRTYPKKRANRTKHSKVYWKQMATSNKIPIIHLVGSMGYRCVWLEKGATFVDRMCRQQYNELCTSE